MQEEVIRHAPEMRMAREKKAFLNFVQPLYRGIAPEMPLLPALFRRKNKINAPQTFPGISTPKSGKMFVLKKSSDENLIFKITPGTPFLQYVCQRLIPNLMSEMGV